MSIRRFATRVAAAVTVTLIAVACGSSSPAARSAVPNPTPRPTPTPVDPVVLTADNFDRVVLGATQPCLVYFTLPTCVPCRTMAPIVRQLATDYQNRALVGEVDPASYNALSRAYRTGPTPYFLFFKSGAEVSRLYGVTTYAELAARLDALIAAP